jgi:hypothetical protein
MTFRRGAETSTRGACAPQSRLIRRDLTPPIRTSDRAQNKEQRGLGRRLITGDLEIAAPLKQKDVRQWLVLRDCRAFLELLFQRVIW